MMERLRPAIVDPGPGREAQLGDLHGLFVLSILMTTCANDEETLRLAATSIPAIGPFRLVGIYLSDGGWVTGIGLNQAAVAGLADQIDQLIESGGGFASADGAWRGIFPFHGGGPRLGCLVVEADQPPTDDSVFKLRVLAQQTAVALGSARLQVSQRAASESAAAANHRLRDTNEQLLESVHVLERSGQIHERLTRVALMGEGLEGIAEALHEITGHAVAVEDQWGNLQAWAGPSRPDPYPKDTPAARTDLLARAVHQLEPTRLGDHLMLVVRPQSDIQGVLVLRDVADEAGAIELVALERAAAVMAMELVRLHSVAEAEMRTHRDLVEDLLTGTDSDRAIAGADALGYDLTQPQRVVVIENMPRVGRDVDAVHAARRAARDVGVVALIVSRGTSVVLLAQADGDWDRLAAVASVEAGRPCQIGVGSLCEQPSDIPTSYQHALLALKIADSAGAEGGVVKYDDLGIYRLLCDFNDLAEVQAFTRRWLAALIDYDLDKGADLVNTLTTYLRCGANQAQAAGLLVVHRNTLRYRLGRIHEISGHDLGDPETRFNLELATHARQTIEAFRSD
jgi:sugar diacid utilization regulator